MKQSPTPSRTLTDMSVYEQFGSLHEMFIRQATATPEATAVVTHDGKQVTYAELDKWTDILATTLRHKGVQRNKFVGIYMERCLEYTVSYIGILKAGGAYLPLDVSYPESMLKAVVGDAEPVAICTKEYFADRIQGLVPAVIVDGEWQQCLEQQNSQLKPFTTPVSVGLDDLAYTVYSSGTTGEPKGVQCPHRGAVFSYHWRHLEYPYEDGDREACNVFFVWEMLRPILRGIPMYIIPDDVIYDPARLCSFLQEHRITRMLFTPSLLEAVLDARGLDLTSSFKSMRQIWFCGEVVTTVLKERVVKTFPGVRIINLYSVSECHDVACADLTNQRFEASRKFCPVGSLLPGVHVLILDEDMKIQPTGVPGEIYVGGPTLAQGYLNRPELTNQRFIPRPSHLPASAGSRLYRAGDWGYMLSDSSLEICGRCDSMVKIRGYSVELQAVEAALLELPMVNTGCVMAVGEEGSNKHLIAYLVPEGHTTSKEVRAILKKRLPFYMIPSKFVFLESIPILESSGKFDKKALPEVDMNSVGDGDLEGLPSTDMERKIARIFCDVLQLPAIDVQENFFDLGGHSLLASKLLYKVNEEFSTELCISDLFSSSTVATMAAMLENTNAVCGEVPRLDLVAEVDRHDQGVIRIDMRLRAFWRSTRLATSKWRRGKVLLTGGTGFLGAFLIKQLLLQTKTTVYCLVREMPGVTIQARLRETLVKYGILGNGSEAEELENKMQTRVVVIKGDVTLINMGMNEEDYAYLTYEVDYIIHAAATVNLIFPYRALHGTNVLGTENVIIFALDSKIKAIHYISTDAVFPHGLTECRENEDMLQFADKMIDGYSQSKWVAEQLVLRAKSRGLPVAIYRCGNIAGTLEGGYWNPTDFTLLMIQGCILSNSAPNIDWQIELTPVDFVSSTIVKMTQNIMLSLGKVFHLTNSTTMHCNVMWQLLKDQGYEINILPYDNWCKVVKSEAKNSPHLTSLSDLVRLLDNTGREEGFFTQMSTYSQENLKSVMQVLGIQYPSMNADLMKQYMKQLVARGFIGRPKWRIQSRDILQSLTGKVAIVTGASSGIGASVAEHLCAAGAKVVLAARRIERLLQLQKKIEREGGIALAVKTDVCKREEVRELVQQTESDLGPVDILVNCAGCMYYTLMKNLHEDEWERQIDINCKGVMNCIGAVLKGMTERGKGHIVNMSSDAGRKGYPALAVYSGTKFFIEGMSQALRQELVSFDIRVTCIQPGDVRTELMQYTTDQEAKTQYDLSESCCILDPEDVGRAVVYAVSQPRHCAVNEILIEPTETPI